MKTFDEIIGDYDILHIDTTKLSDVIRFITFHKYDIVSFNDMIILNSGDTLLLTRDYITNIEANDDVSYLIDDIEYEINNKTKLITFMSPFKSIMLRNKSNLKQTITFKRHLISYNIIHKINTNDIIYDGNHIYHNGMINHI